MSRRPRAAALLAASALVLGGCGEDPPQPPETVTVTHEPTAEPLDKPEQQQVDEATAKKALPTLDDMPSAKWAAEDLYQRKAPSTYSPASCAARARASD